MELSRYVSLLYLAFAAGENVGLLGPGSSKFFSEYLWYVSALSAWLVGGC